MVLQVTIASFGVVAPVLAVEVISLKVAAQPKLIIDAVAQAAQSARSGVCVLHAGADFTIVTLMHVSFEPSNLASTHFEALGLLCSWYSIGYVYLPGIVDDVDFGLVLLELG